MTIDEVLTEEPAEGEGDDQAAKEGTDDAQIQEGDIEDVPSHDDPPDVDDEPNK
jgi:hypothetical protein